jgi:hypothetical protein
LGDFSIAHSSILREHAFARRLTPQWCAFETISVGGAKAMTRDFLLVLELYHLFCNFVGGVMTCLFPKMYKVELSWHQGKYLSKYAALKGSSPVIQTKGWNKQHSKPHSRLIRS